ncbi:hypothetical protein PBI_SHEPARD_21 [Arthrobacter phage Shepard]|nr:hypothetical protein PBI_SHEPARD_21 [Arthrobacter phage Shepard]UYL88216.1 hypothetical protein SEA_LILHUDDY_21 [Arthrobacter phage LilHuddy]
MAEQKYVVLEGSKVVNVILWDPEDANAANFELPGTDDIRLATDDVGIGWELANNEWVPPVAEEQPPIPHEDQSVTDAKYQGLAELMAAGISEPTARLIVGLPPAEEVPA